LLGEAGLSVLVVEPQSEIYNIPRAMYFDGEVMRIFQAMGLEREISERSTQGKNCLYQWAWVKTLRTRHKCCTTPQWMV